MCAMAQMGRWKGERMQTERFKLMKPHDQIDRSTSGKGRSTPAGKGREGQGRGGASLSIHGGTAQLVRKG